MTTPRRVLATAATSLGVVLVPKCPLCVAAYLAGIGVGAGAATALAPWVRIAAWLLLGLALAAWPVQWARGRRRPVPACCR